WTPTQRRRTDATEYAQSVDAAEVVAEVANQVAGRIRGEEKVSRDCPRVGGRAAAGFGEGVLRAWKASRAGRRFSGRPSSILACRKETALHARAVRHPIRSRSRRVAGTDQEHSCSGRAR